MSSKVFWIVKFLGIIKTNALLSLNNSATKMSAMDGHLLLDDLIWESS